MNRKAFTLVEILIVVTILGILAAVVLPTLQGQTAIARESTAKDSLSTMRTQIEMYKLRHVNSGSETTIRRDHICNRCRFFFEGPFRSLPMWALFEGTSRKSL
ncbi:MAG: type II secretion system protein [Planctomycetota bacterium]|jgi:prepilin-type N-terminal cleavage/methylation domain-containing protein